MVKLWHHRTYTRNHTWYLDVGRRCFFLKANPSRAEARQERAGYDAIADLYSTPRLHWAGGIGTWALHVSERSPHVADGLLLIDAIARAEASQDLGDLDLFLDAVLTHYRTTILATARHVPGDQTVGKLYRNRATRGGRLDDYYSTREPWVLPTGPWWPGGRELLINGTRRRPDLPAIIDALRRHLCTDARVWGAVTQGDPTDFNLAWSRSAGALWFDYDTAGLNAIAGEFACFLVCQLLHGPWLTPRYNVAAFDDHPAALDSTAYNHPAVRAEPAGGTIALTYGLDPGQVRTHVVHRYLTELVLPVAQSLGIRDLDAWLRPYLLMRLLAVYDIATLQPEDAALTLALVAELSDDTMSIPAVFPTLRTTPTGVTR